MNRDMDQSKASGAPLISSLGSLPESGSPNLRKREEAWIKGSVTTPIGQIPRVTTDLDLADRVGSMKARWTWGRMKYRVAPGLYAVGNATSGSPVFVSANYKMSFDRLRRELGSIDSWIMVIDTRGINVWCAAGKGTFGTDEIAARVQLVRLKEIVSHRRLILPQLGAPGVAAHEVRKRCGFKVVYGPVRAEDISAYLEAGRKTTPSMRLANFGLRDRSVLVPTELVLAFKYALPIAFLFVALSSLGTGILSMDRLTSYGLLNGVLVLLTAASGAILPAILLPWLPGRPFSLKGLWVGLIVAMGIAGAAIGSPDLFENYFSAGSWLLIAPAVISYLSMNFTGSSTYTSLSGVMKEMRLALPLQIGAVVLGLGLWVTGLLV